GPHGPALRGQRLHVLGAALPRSQAGIPSVRLRSQPGRHRGLQLQAALGIRAGPAPLPVRSPERGADAEPEPVEPEAGVRGTRLEARSPASHQADRASAHEISPMNILMLGRWLPPPRRPVRDTREYQFGRYLVRDHHLTVAFVTDNPDTTGAISALRKEFTDIEFAVMPRTWKSLEAALRAATGESCTLSYARSGALRTRLEDRIRRSDYDLVFVLSSSMIQ